MSRGWRGAPTPRRPPMATGGPGQGQAPGGKRQKDRTHVHVYLAPGATISPRVVGENPSRPMPPSKESLTGHYILCHAETIEPQRSHHM